MAKILGKNPFHYEKERDSFLSELKQFHACRGTSFCRQPSVRGKEVDLYLLYSRVTDLGGYDKVNDVGLWEELVEDYGIPKLCTNGAQAIKQFYQRYLYLYEKVSKGEDPDQREEGDEPTAKRKKIEQFFSIVPAKYNHLQHIVADTVRRNLGMSTDIIKREKPYDKLEKGLLSGLPNEVDFAINVCTLLSNEGKHTLNVSHSPRLIEILMAHVGIFREGAGSLFTLHHEGWRPCTKRNFERFWIDSVEDKEVRELLSPLSLFETDKGEKLSKAGGLVQRSEYEELRNSVLHLGPDLGVHDMEGQRILQLAMIIRNLSFEEENMAFLASDLLVFRFLMLCIHNKYWTLKQLGLDTFGNLALKMELDPLAYPTTQLVLGLVTRCVSSPDRFEVVRGLEILARLCHVVNNWDMVAESLEQRVYDDIINLLTVHDIQLIVFTLEALYHLSELGEVTSNHIAKVVGSIDTLVQMVTIEAQAYGPNSLLGIKVVEHVPAGLVVQPQPGIPPMTPHGIPLRSNVQRQLHPHPGPGVRLPGTPQRPPGAPTPPRPAGAPTPPLPRPGITPSPVPFRKGPMGTPLRPGVMNAFNRAGTPPYQRPGMSPQPVGAPGMIRAQTPGGGGFIQRPLVNRTRNPAPTVNQAECDAIAVAWLNAYYEIVPGSVSVKNEVYAEYLATCSRYAIKNALNSAGFSECIKVAFPQIQHQRVERDDGTLEMQLLGVMRRPTPHAFPPPPKRVLTGYVNTPSGYKPVVQYQTPTPTSIAPAVKYPTPGANRPAMIPRPVAPSPALVAAAPAAVPVRPVTVSDESAGTVVIQARGLPPAAVPTPVLSAQPNNVAPLQPLPPAPPQPASSQHTECAQAEGAMEVDPDSSAAQHEACLPVNRPPSRRRSCSGSGSSPPLSPKGRSPKSPRAKSPRPLSPKGTRQSARLNPGLADLNSDLSHAQMERLEDQLTGPVEETAIEKVENPCVVKSAVVAATTDTETGNNRPNTRESRQNGSVTKVNGGADTTTNTRADVGSSSSDESQARVNPLHLNGDVLSPAPSDSSTAAPGDPLSPKRNGAATTSPSILDKKAKIAQLLQDTAAAKEALGLGQNGIVTHLGNGDFSADDKSDQGVLPTAEGLTQQVTEATALLPETNGCEDDYLGNSTDGANDFLCDDDDVLLGYSVDGTNDNLQEGNPSADSNSTGTLSAATDSTVADKGSLPPTVISTPPASQLQFQGISTGGLSNAVTTLTPSLEQPPQNSSSTTPLTAVQQVPAAANTQVVNVALTNPVVPMAALVTHPVTVIAQPMPATSSITVPAAQTNVQSDKPSNSAAIVDILQRKLVQPQPGVPVPLTVVQTGGVPAVVAVTSAGAPPPVQVNPRMPGVNQQLVAVNVVPPARNTTPQSHLMQQLQQRLQRPNPNTQVQQPQQVTVMQTQASNVASQPPVGLLLSQNVTNNEGTPPQHIVVGSGATNVTSTHNAVQQQLLQRLRAPHLVQQQQQQQQLQQLQQQNVFQPRQQVPLNTQSSTVIIVQQGLPGQPQVQVPLQQQQQQQESHSRPSSTGPPSRPPSRPPSVGPTVALPPSTGPAPLPSPSGSDASTLPPASPPPAGQIPARRPSTASTTSNDSRTNVKGKKRKAKSNSIDSKTSSACSATDMQFMCEWNNCNTCFENAKAVGTHVIKEHVPQLPLQGLCPWEKCDGLRRGKWSLLTHVQDKHLTEAALKAAATRRQQQQPPPSSSASSYTPSNNNTATNSSSNPGSAPVYPQDAALQAIRRFAPRPPYPELGETKEGPVTKHIRLTSALILRNIAKYSSYGRSLLKRHESHLACMALSAVEASTALSHVLAELEHHTLTSPAAKPEESDAEEADDDDAEDSDADSERAETLDTADVDVTREVLAH